MRIVFFIIASLSLMGTCLAQHDKPSPADGAKESSTGIQQRNKVTVDMPATSYRKVGQAQISYFAASDSTEVRIEVSPYREQGQAANMFFVLLLKGRDVVPPQVVSIGLVFFTDKARAGKLGEFTFEADGESLKLNDMTSQGVVSDLREEKWSRGMKGTVFLAQFEKLVHSKGLKVHVGGVSFELDRKSRDGMRDMLRAIEQLKTGSQ